MSSNLLKIEAVQTPIGSIVHMVSAKALHERLGVKRDFSTWIKGRIDGYGFEEGVDYFLNSPILVDQKLIINPTRKKAPSEGSGGDHKSHAYNLCVLAPTRSGMSLPLSKLGDGRAVHAIPFQTRVQPWMAECFGEMIAGDTEERNHRFLEESLELVQACGCSQGAAHQLVGYVYGRPLGEKHQEVGGVMITLAALCLAQHLDMHACGETELSRIWTKIEQIRAKQAGKPKHSPLPQFVLPSV